MSKRTRQGKSSRHILIPDLLVFLALSVLPIASFWLASYPNANFYTALLTISLIVIFGLHSYKSVWELIKQSMFQYDLNLNPLSLGIIIAGAFGMIVFSSVYASAIGARSLLTVPSAQLALSYGQVSLPPFWSDTLYQITLVASAEEASKLVVIIFVFLMAKRVIGKKAGAVVAVVSAVGGWALLHTFQNPDYQGSTMIPMVAGAFIDGIIILGVLYLTHSWLAAVLCHFSFNEYILIQQYNLFSLSSSMIVPILPLAVAPLVLNILLFKVLTR